MKLLPKLILLIIVLLILRLALGLGSAAFHYSNTQSYRDYIAEHPVSPEFFAQQVELPTPLRHGRNYQQGEAPVKDWKADGESFIGGFEMAFEIDHGKDSVMFYTQKGEYFLSNKNNEHLGFFLSGEGMSTGTNIRTVVLVWLDDDALKMGPGTAAKGKVTVDVFALSGGGTSEVYYFNAKDRETAYRNQTLGLPIRQGSSGSKIDEEYPLWRLATGIANHFGEAPAEGLIHFSSQTVHLWWQKSGVNLSNSGHAEPKFSVNTDEYSYDKSVKVSSFLDRKRSLSTTSSVSRNQQWNDEVW
jgi:hypothetical protein